MLVDARDALSSKTRIQNPLATRNAYRDMRGQIPESIPMAPAFSLKLHLSLRFLCKSSALTFVSVRLDFLLLVFFLHAAIPELSSVGAEIASSPEQHP